MRPPDLDKTSVKQPPVKTAVALSYDSEHDLAPKVVASGKGLMAEQIIALAQANQIPIQEDEVLTQALAQVDLEQVIPPELYSVVAEILAFVYRIRQKRLVR